MHPVLETRQAMFWVSLVVQCAGEPEVTANRIAVALLRTKSGRELLERRGTDPAAVIAALDAPGELSFEECARRMTADVEKKGLAFASKEHQETVEWRPLEPAVKKVFHEIIEREGALTIAPDELLLELMRVDPALATKIP
jgi:hypothetical protein